MTYVPNMIHICPNKRCLDVFGGEIRERRERICLGNYPKSFFFFLQNEGSGDIYGLWHAPQGLAHLVCVLGQLGWRQQFCLFPAFWFQIWLHIWRPLWTLIEPILVFLESFGWIKSYGLEKRADALFMVFWITLPF